MLEFKLGCYIGSSDGTHNFADRWSNGYKSWWPIYTPHPGHLKIAGVAGHPTHTQEHLQAIQKHQDHILSPLAHFESVV